MRSVGKCLGETGIDLGREFRIGSRSFADGDIFFDRDIRRCVQHLKDGFVSLLNNFHLRGFICFSFKPLDIALPCFRHSQRRNDKGIELTVLRYDFCTLCLILRADLGAQHRRHRHRGGKQGGAQ